MEQYVSSEWKIHTSKVKIYFEKLNHFHLLWNPLSEESDLDDEPPASPTLFSLSTETKRLYCDVMKYSSAPHVIDLTDLNTKRAVAKRGKAWVPKKNTPAHQVIERKMEGKQLTRRVHGLLARVSAIGMNL